MKSWVNRHRGLVFLGIGLLLVVISNTSQYSLTKEYTSKLESIRISQESKITKLVEENRSLKQKTKTYKLIKPDGTIEERTESELEDVSSVSTSMQSEYKKTLEKLQFTIHESYNQNQKLGLAIGITSSLDYFGYGTYELLSPFTIGGGLIWHKDQYPTYLITVGIKL